MGAGGSIRLRVGGWCRACCGTRPDSMPALVREVRLLIRTWGVSILYRAHRLTSGSLT